MALTNQQPSVSTYANDKKHVNINNVINSLIIDKNNFDDQKMQENYQNIHIPYAAAHITELKDQIIKCLRLDIIKDILNSENVTEQFTTIYGNNY